MSRKKKKKHSVLSKSYDKVPSHKIDIHASKDDGTGALNKIELQQQYLECASYEGPIPPPVIMEAYQRIDPSFPERIMREFERNSEHIRSQEKLALEASAKDIEWSHWMAFLLSIFLLAIVLVSVYMGNYTLIGISALMFFAYVIMSFLGSKRMKDN